MADDRQFCTFTLDKLLFGVEVRDVQEVIRYQHITYVPRAAESVHGLINLRGQIVTAIDLRSRLKLPKRPSGLIKSMASLFFFRILYLHYIVNIFGSKSSHLCNRIIERFFYIFSKLFAVFDDFSKWRWLNVLQNLEKSSIIAKIVEK